MNLRSALYTAARLLGDIHAVTTGRAQGGLALGGVDYRETRQMIAAIAERPASASAMLFACRTCPSFIP